MTPDARELHRVITASVRQLLGDRPEVRRASVTAELAAIGGRERRLLDGADGDGAAEAIRGRLVCQPFEGATAQARLT